VVSILPINSFPSETLSNDLAHDVGEAFFIVHWPAITHRADSGEGERYSEGKPNSIPG
jgi:hypothetical protein